MKKITFDNKPNIEHIINGKSIWVSRSPAVVGVVIAKYKDDDYVLIGQRGDGAADNIGLWNVPCGYLDWDETGTNGIIREIYEETGLYILDIQNIIQSNLEQPFYVNTDINKNKQNVSLSYGLYFRCQELPKLSIDYCEPGEVSDVKWIKVSDMNNYKYAFKHKERIESYFDIINKNKFMKKIKNFLKKRWIIILVMGILLFLFSFLHGIKSGLIMTTGMGLVYWFLYKL